VVPIYIVAWQLFGCIALGTYMSCKGQSAAAANAVKPWYVLSISFVNPSDTLQVGRNILCYC
jgi:hypothetical protein